MPLYAHLAEHSWSYTILETCATQNLARAAERRWIAEMLWRQKKLFNKQEVESARIDNMVREMTTGSQQEQEFADLKARAEAQGGSIIGSVFLLRLPEKPDRPFHWTGTQWEWLS